MTALARIFAAAAAVSGGAVAINHSRLVAYALAHSEAWDGGRGDEAVALTVGVFGGGAVVMAIVALLALAGLVFGARSARSALWLLSVPGVVGLAAAVVATGVWLAVQPSGSEYLAYVVVPLAVPPVLALVAGTLLRSRSRSGAGGSASLPTSAHSHLTPTALSLTIAACVLLSAALAIALPTSTSAGSVPDHDPETLDEAVQMVRSLQQSGASNQRIGAWLSEVLDRRITNVNSLERMSIAGNWLRIFGESAADRAFGEWRDGNEDYDYRKSAAWAWANRLGQCNEHACTAYYILKRAGVAGDLRILVAPNHEFVVWGMSPGAIADDPTTWGDDACVVDGWLGKATTAHGALTGTYYKGGGSRVLDDATRKYDQPLVGQGTASANGAPAEAPSVRYEGRLAVRDAPPLPVYRLSGSDVELVVAGDTVAVTIAFTLVAVVKWDGDDHLCTATMYRKYTGTGTATNPLRVKLTLVDASDELEGPDCQGVAPMRVQSQPLIGRFSADGTFVGAIRRAWRVTATARSE